MRGGTYNGHKNWNHWNVSLWLLNVDSRYGLVCDFVKRYRTLDLAARHLMVLLAGRHTPDGAPYTYTSVRAALRGMGREQ